MSIIVHIILGLAIAAVGVLFVLRTPDILDFFGPVEWAERHLGGSSFFYKLLGVAITLIGFIVATDLWNAFLAATLGKIFISR